MLPHQVAENAGRARHRNGTSPQVSIRNGGVLAPLRGQRTIGNETLQKTHAHWFPGSGSWRPPRDRPAWVLES